MIQNEIMKSSGRAAYVAVPVPGLDGGGRAGVILRDGQGDSVQKVERAIAYMVEHINKPLQVATLAARANVSSSHFFALFKQRMGCPPMDYFTRLRMRQACRLLGSTSASVKEVAAALGYDDPFYFSRVFKSVNHVAPSRYRVTRTDFGDACESHSSPLPRPGNLIRA